MFNVKYFTTSSGRSPVDDFILKQDAQVVEKILETIGFLEEFGFQLSTNYLRKISGRKKHLGIENKMQIYKL